VSLNTAIVIACHAVTDFLCEKYTMQREVIIRTLFTIKNTFPVFIMVLSSHHGYAETRRLISYKKQFFDTGACNEWAILSGSV
jgi:hypothetical protein